MLCSPRWGRVVKFALPITTSKYTHFKSTLVKVATLPQQDNTRKFLNNDDKV